MCLVTKIIQVELVHESFHGELNFPALSRARDPIADPDKFNSAKLEAMIAAHQLGHVSRESRNVLDQDDVERTRGFSSRGEKPLVSRAMSDAETRESLVAECLDDDPIPPTRVALAQSRLVLD